MHGIQHPNWVKSIFARFQQTVARAIHVLRANPIGWWWRRYSDWRLVLTLIMVVAFISMIAMPASVALAFHRGKPAPNSVQAWLNSSDEQTTIYVYRVHTGETVAMPLGEYLIDVLAAELPPNAPPAALEAAAVAARTYAVQAMLAKRSGMVAPGATRPAITTLTTGNASNVSSPPSAASKTGSTSQSGSTSRTGSTSQAGSTSRTGSSSHAGSSSQVGATSQSAPASNVVSGGQSRSPSGSASQTGSTSQSTSRTGSPSQSPSHTRTGSQNAATSQTGSASQTGSTSQTGSALQSGSTSQAQSTQAAGADVTDSGQYDLPMETAAAQDARWGSQVDEMRAKYQAAILATDGLIVSYKSLPILAFSFPLSPGVTRSAEEVFHKSIPYLQAVPAPDDKRAAKQPIKFYTLAELSARLGFSAKGAALTQFAVTKRLKDGFVVGVTGPGGASWTGSTFEQKLGLSSSDFTLKVVRDKLAVETYGIGADVGLSLHEAAALAARGETWQRILATFYPGTGIMSDVGFPLTSFQQ